MPTPENCILVGVWPSMMAADFIKARRTITLTALSFLPADPNARTPFGALCRELIAAAARGVRVEITIPAPTQSHPATHGNLRAAKWAERNRIHCNLYHTPRLLHAKTATIDTRIAWCGSGNFTAAAASSNHERYVRIESATIAARLAAFCYDPDGDQLPRHRA